MSLSFPTFQVPWNLLAFILITVIGVISARLTLVYSKRFFEGRLARNEVNVFSRALALLVGAAFIVIGMPLIGIDVAGLLVLGGFAGIVVGFAAGSIVSNLLSGLFLVIERPIRIGDQVDVAGIQGYVEDITVFSTRIRTYDGKCIRIPNEKVFTSKVTNLVAYPIRRVDVTVNISYSDDIEHAIQTILRLAEKNPLILKYPEPRVYVDTLADSGVNLAVRLWTPREMWFDVKTRILHEIKEAFDEEGIEIPYPQLVVRRPSNE